MRTTKNNKFIAYTSTNMLHKEKHNKTLHLRESCITQKLIDWFANFFGGSLLLLLQSDFICTLWRYFETVGQIFQQLANVQAIIREFSKG